MTDDELDRLEALRDAADNAVQTSDEAYPLALHTYHRALDDALPALIAEVRRLQSADTAKWQAVSADVINAWVDLDLWLGDAFLDDDTEQARERMSRDIAALGETVAALPGAITVRSE